MQKKVKNFSLAFSPCPNDTFIFHALTHGLVDTEGYGFDVTMADVEELNQRAALGEFEICKLSYNAYLSLTDKYKMLRSGSALGFNNGPLFVVKAGNKDKILNDNSLTIAVPGMHTTAVILFRSAFSSYVNLKPMLFSEIENAVLNGVVDAGVLIHEGRFTYKNKGLELVADLGVMWQDKFNLPIPLGGIAIRKDLLDYESNITDMIRRSVEFAMLNPECSKDFIRENAQEMLLDVQKKHIELFVNDFTIDYGDLGEKAIVNLENEIKRQRKVLL